MKTEYQEQIAVVEYLELLKKQGKILMFSATPNNTWTRSWGQKIKNKKEGVRRGYPDLTIVTPTTVLFLEMKRESGGVLSKEQKEWLAALGEKQTKQAVAKGFEEAKEIIDSLTIK